MTALEFINAISMLMFFFARGWGWFVAYSSARDELRLGAKDVGQFSFLLPTLENDIWFSPGFLENTYTLISCTSQQMLASHNIKSHHVATIARTPGIGKRGKKKAAECASAGCVFFFLEIE